jgi:hypothetical protein
MNQQALDEANELVSIGESMDRLLRNEDFRKVFLDRYLKEDVINEGLGLSRIPADRRQLAVDRLMARGFFHSFVNEIIEQAISARDYLSTLEGEV